jgi:hypothetical protein
VKKREGPKFAALPLPGSKSSVPSGVSQSGGDGTEEEEGSDTGGGNEEDEGDEGSEDDENNDEDDTRAELEERSSDDEFESATSSPGPEGVGMSDPSDNPHSVSWLRETPNSMIDAMTAELRALEDRRRREDAELHRARRKDWDLDGPGWKLFARHTRGLGIEVYQLYTDGRRVWRYKAYDTGHGEIVSSPQDPEHRVEVDVEELKDAGWYQERESGAWKRYSTTEELGRPFAVDPSIPLLPSSLQSTSDESQKGQDSDTLFLGPQSLGGSSTQGNTS